MDGAIMPQAFIPVVLDMETTEPSNGGMATQILDNGILSGQRMIILPPGMAIPSKYMTSLI